jgi:hypothetical protein
MRDNFESGMRLPRQQLPAVVKAELPQVRASSALERAKQALAECLSVDEAREIADEAKAIAKYATEKKGAEDLLRLARQIQIRAYRRIGQLLRDHKEKFAINSMEYTAIKIASMEEVSFEMALASEARGVGPHEFARQHVPRPPPIFKEETPEGRARRIARWQKQMGAEKAESINVEIVNFHAFIKQCTPLSAAAIFESRAEKRRVREQIRELQDWLDELDRQLKIPGGK